jgi:D-glycero-D-manno-heptose 1,7-bisphosphate phosphatase
MSVSAWARGCVTARGAGDAGGACGEEKASMGERSTADGGRPAIFLMCDGVLSERGNVLAGRLDDGALLSTALDGLRLLSRRGVPVLALVRRGSRSHESHQRRVDRTYVDRVGAELCRRGACIEAMLFAPASERSHERARAAMARLLRLAARTRGIDLGSSFLICDRWTDVEAGLDAGCQPLLVMTGSGRAEIIRPQTARVQAQTWYAADLMMAALSVDAHIGAGNAGTGGRALPRVSAPPPPPPPPPLSARHAPPVV